MIAEAKPSFLQANLATMRITGELIGRYPFHILFVAAAALRLIALGTAPLWYDEAGAVWMASLPIARLIAATAGDVHPPLFFLILKPLYELFGANPWVMRLPSALFGLAALPLTKGIGEHIGLSRRATLFACALMAVSAFELWYSQEARMYALLQFCVLAMVLMGLQRRWGWFILAATAAMYSQNFGLIYYAALCFVLVGREFLKPLYTVQWYRLFAVLAVPPLLFTPWAFVIAGQMKNYAADWIPQVTVGGWLQPLIEYWWPGAMVQSWYLPVVIGAFILLAYAIAYAMANRSLQGMFLGWLLFAPMIAAAIVSLAWKPMYISRPFISGAPFAYLLIAMALTATPKRAALMAALLAPVLLLNTVAYYPSAIRSKTTELPASKVVAVIETNWLPGDIIYHGNVGTMLPMWPFLEGTNTPQYLMPVVGWSAGMLRQSTREAMGMQEIPIDQLVWKRAWLVWSAGPTIDPAEDAVIASILARYPHEQFMNYDYGYATFGLWLLGQGVVAVGN